MYVFFYSSNNNFRARGGGVIERDSSEVANRDMWRSAILNIHFVIKNVVCQDLVDDI